MRTSRSSRCEAVVVFVALSMMVACARGTATDDSCSAFEATKSLQGNTATFRDERFPWIVTADLDAKVTIQNTKQKTSCSTTVESVVSVYMGTGDVIYFRSLEIASDNLYPVNGLSCADSGESVRLDPTSAEKSRNLIRASGICATQ